MMKILSEMSFFNVADGGHDGVGPLGDLENGGGLRQHPQLFPQPLDGSKPKLGRFLGMGMDFVYPHLQEPEELLQPVGLRGPEVLQRQGVQQQQQPCQYIVTLRELQLGQNIEGTSPLIV